MAKANAAEIVTRASPRRRGTGIGRSSPASTKADRTTNSAGSLTCQSGIQGTRISAPTASVATAAT
jgi:hypothetical protein